MIKPLLVSSLAIGFVSAVFAQSTPKQLSARELYYWTAPPAAAKSEAPKTAPKKSTAPAKRAVPAVSKPVEAVSADPPITVSRPAPPTRSVQATLPGDARVQTAAMTSSRTSAPPPANGPALGLKYSILQSVGGQMREVPPDTVFHAGDRIQFRVQANGPGYLYIINRGSSGTWKPMFPSPDVENGDNRVEGLRSYDMPPNSRIVFDEQTGIENVFIVLSRQPEADLEQMIYSLEGKPAPASTPAPRAAPKQLLMASNINIDDRTVGRLRTTYSRDLVIETVNPASVGEKKETAVYVVNPTGGSDSRLVADLRLVHR